MLNHVSQTETQLEVEAKFVYQDHRTERAGI